MKLKKVKDVLNAEILVGEDKLDREVFLACGCDLMSDVLRFAKEDVVLLTGLTNQHVLRTAEMANIHCLIFVRSKVPNQEMLKEAQEMGMIILTTELPLYESCGRLYTYGLGNQMRCKDE